MKKNFTTASIFALASLLILFSVGCDNKTAGPSGPDGVSVFKMVPADATGMFMINFKKLASLSVFDKMKEDIAKKELPDKVKIFENYNDFVTKTGIDPKKDLYSVVFAVYGDMGKAKEKQPDFSMILNLKYEKEKILSILKEKVESLSQFDYLGAKLYKFKDEKGKDVALYFSENNFISAGTENGLKKIVDLAKGKVKSLDSNKKMMEYVSRIEGSPVFEFVFAVPEDVRGMKGSGMFQADLSKAEAVYGDVDYTGMDWSGKLVMVSQNEEGNKKLKTTLDSLKGFGAMAGPEFAELINNINISSSPENLTISFTVSTELLEKLKKKAEQKMGSMKSGKSPLLK